MKQELKMKLQMILNRLKLKPDKLDEMKKKIQCEIDTKYDTFDENELSYNNSSNDWESKIETLRY